jgi:hypothetical protein
MKDIDTYVLKTEELKKQLDSSYFKNNTIDQNILGSLYQTSNEGENKIKKLEKIVQYDVDYNVVTPQIGDSFYKQLNDKRNKIQKTRSWAQSIYGDAKIVEQPKETEKKETANTVVKSIITTPSKFGVLGVASYNKNDQVTGFGANLSLAVPFGPIEKICTEGVWTNYQKNSSVTTTVPMGVYTFVGKTDTKGDIQNFSWLGGFETGKVAGFSLTGLVGAENDYVKNVRTGDGKIYQNGNEVSHNSQEKTDDSKNVTGVLYGGDLNLTIDGVKISGGVRANKDGIKNYVIKIGGEF